VCDHGARKGRVWLPSFERGAYKGKLRRYKYCKNCGTVKGNGRRVGYFLNALGSNGLRLSKVQRRMIAEELLSLEMFTDPYGSILDIQVQMFSKIVGSHSDRSCEMVESVLH